MAEHCNETPTATLVGSSSPSGVFIANDFRDNLIVDRYDPVFASMRASKLRHLRSQNSEDAVTWNVFRSLRQIDPATWLPLLATRAFPDEQERPTPPAMVDLWMRVPPPPPLLAQGDEGESEIDVVMESDTWVWFIEAKYQSDISTGTTTRPTRDQVLRNIDVGTYYARDRAFYFSLLVASESLSSVGVKAIETYRSLEQPRRLLAGHRPDQLHNLIAISLLTWSVLGEVLRHTLTAATRTDERGYAVRALEWMERKGLVPYTV